MKYEYAYCFFCAKKCGSYYYDCSPMTYKSPGRHGSGKLVSTYDTHKKNTMEARFKTVDVVVENDINFSMVKMTIELRRERFREDQLLFENEFIQKKNFCK